MAILHHEFRLLLWLLINQVMALNWTAVQDSLDANTYLGSTPYQNDSFHSESIANAFRTQRDIATNVTIDMLVWPALYMTNAYFGKNYTLQKISASYNVLLLGYKRLVIDLYWNSRVSTWQLCPLDFETNTTDDNVALENGYECATGDSFGAFLQSIDEFLIATEIDNEPSRTDIVFLIFNLHEINTANSSKVHHDANLGHIIQESISLSSSLFPRIYTPINLTMGDGNVTASADLSRITWPVWLNLIEQHVQLIVGYGTLPSTATSFQLTLSDNNTLFDANQLGGFMNSSTDICPSNQSWTFVNDFQAPFTYDTALQLTECDYSPYFTHSNYSTPTSIYSPYDSGHIADNVLSTIWSWDVNEPQAGEYLRCAAMKTENGRWQALDCSGQYRVACRLANDPSLWVLTKDGYNYERSLTACPENYVFDVPRLPIQNKILTRLVQSENVTEDHIWINLNLAYNMQQCWVVGRYGTCWWLTTTGEEFIGLIRTSIVSGVIILILVGIFIWVKCARKWRNRNSKSRKAMVKAMLKRKEYVTVPA